MKPSSHDGGNGPLEGLRIVVTRPEGQGSALIEGLSNAGAIVNHAPSIRIAPPIDRGALLRAAKQVGQYDWVVFTSTNAVRSFGGALRDTGAGPDALDHVAICAIGPATASAVNDLGGVVTLMAGKHVADGVVQALIGTGRVAGAKILLPRAEIARAELPERLRRAGAHVDDVVAYRTVQDQQSARRLRDEMQAGVIDLVTFTSGSTVRSFAKGVTHDLAGVAVATIGPVTTAAARAIGWSVDIEASIQSSQGLVDAVVEHYRGQLRG